MNKADELSEIEAAVSNAICTLNKATNAAAKKDLIVDIDYRAVRLTGSHTERRIYSAKLTKLIPS